MSKDRTDLEQSAFSSSSLVNAGRQRCLIKRRGYKIDMAQANTQGYEGKQSYPNTIVLITPRSSRCLRNVTMTDACENQQDGWRRAGNSREPDIKEPVIVTRVEMQRGKVSEGPLLRSSLQRCKHSPALVETGASRWTLPA